MDASGASAVFKDESVSDDGYDDPKAAAAREAADRMPKDLQLESILSFDPELYPLHELIGKVLLGEERARTVKLQDLHTLPEFEHRKRGRPTLAYNRWRNKGPTKESRNEFGDDFRFEFGRFVDGVVRPQLGHGELVYQREPVLRVHVPGDRPLGNKHRDEEYGRQPWEVNLWLPLTPVFGSNSLWAETERGLEDWHPFVAPGPGSCVKFWGSQCEHFTKANATGVTRVSLDFRAVPEDLYVDGYISPVSERGSAMLRRGQSYTDTTAERSWRSERVIAAGGGVTGAPAAALVDTPSRKIPSQEER